MEAAVVRPEHPVRPGQNAPAVDLFIIIAGLYRIVIEAELSPKRAHNDVAKAVQLDADLLVIVVPDWGLARAIRRRLAISDTTDAPLKPEVWVLPLGPALRRLREKRDFVTEAFVTRHQSHKSSAVPSAEGTRPRSCRPVVIAGSQQPQEERS
jgi:hypothetical protein